MKGKERYLYLPVITGFMGREAELKALGNGFRSKHIIVIEGIAGTGKTYLVCHFINQMEGDFSIFFKECKGDLNLHSLLVEVNEYLKGEGEMGFELVLHETRIDHETKMRALVDILERRMHIIVLDDFHNLQDEGIQKLILFLDRFLKRSRIIIISRTSPPLIRKLDPNNVEEIHLGGFNEEEAVSYLKRGVNVDEAILKQVFKKTGGLPLALNLFIGLLRYYSIEDLVSQPSRYAKDIFNRYLIDKVFELLSGDETEMITRFSVFRSPVRKDAIYYLYPMANWEEVLISLIDKLLIIKNGELFSMQPFIREFAYERLGERRKYHIVAARYYLRDGNTENGLEAYYHYLQAKEFKGLKDVLIRIGDKLIRRGDIELAHRLIKETLQMEEAGELHLLLGKIYQVWGRLDEAILEYEIAYNGVGDLSKKALAKNQIGGVYLLREDYHKARPFLEESLHLRRHINEKAGIAEGLHQMGVLHIGLGRYGEAKKYLLEALRITEDLGDKGAMAETLNELARIDFYEKEYDIAISRLMNGVTLSRETSDKRTEGTLLHNIGSVYLERQDYEEAEKGFLESLKIKEEIGDRFGLAHTYHQLGNLYMEKGNKEKARTYFEKSKMIFRELGSPKIRYPQYFLDQIDIK